MTPEFLETLFLLIRARADEAYHRATPDDSPDYAGLDEYNARSNAEDLEKELRQLIQPK